MAWILFGANRTPPFIPWPKKSALSVIQFVVSCRLTFRIFRFECDFICDVFICSASHLPLPSHTTHSVEPRYHSCQRRHVSFVHSCCSLDDSWAPRRFWQYRHWLVLLFPFLPLPLLSSTPLLSPTGDRLRRPRSGTAGKSSSLELEGPESEAFGPGSAARGSGDSDSDELDRDTRKLSLPFPFRIWLKQCTALSRANLKFET